MTITLTEYDRKLLIKRFRQASKMKHPEQVVTVLQVTEVYSGHHDSLARNEQQ